MCNQAIKLDTRHRQFDTQPITKSLWHADLGHVFHDFTTSLEIWNFTMYIVVHVHHMHTGS